MKDEQRALPGGSGGIVSCGVPDAAPADREFASESDAAARGLGRRGICQDTAAASRLELGLLTESGGVGQDAAAASRLELGLLTEDRKGQGQDAAAARRLELGLLTDGIEVCEELLWQRDLRW
jgi:hypothetical protein